jgi:polygalacturonase
LVFPMTRTRKYPWKIILPLGSSLFAGAVASTSLSEVRTLTGRSNVFDVTDFGARGDGVTKDTFAIAGAVAAVAAAGEGTILFPSGKQFLTAPFNLTSHCTIFIASGASIVGSKEMADYPVIAALPSYGEGKKGGPGRRMPLIHGQNLKDVVVTGETGTIDGNGATWWYNKTSGDTPPHLVELMWSSDFEISNLTLQNSPFWTVHPYVVDGFVVRHVWIFNPTNITNTDGIDPDSTRHALIEHVYIVTGDDGIAIKSGWDEYGYDYGQPSENITIRNVAISTPCAAIAVGSEMSGGVRQVTVSGARLWDSTAGVHVKSGPGRGGYVHGE